MNTKLITKPYAAVALLIAIAGFALHGRAGVLTPNLISRSTASATTTANGSSSAEVMSADGRYIAFASNATDLVPGLIDNNSAFDIFLADTQTGSIRCISLSAPNTTGNGISFAPIITRDGRYIVFTSEASNLVANDNNARRDVFRYDAVTNESRAVSLNLNGTSTPNGDSGGAGGGTYDISDNGRFIVFISLATDISNVADTNNGTDVFRRDMAGTGISLISRSRTGASTGDGESSRVNISRDGRIIAFSSAAGDLITGVNDGNLASDIFVRNTTTNITRCATLRRSDPTLTANVGGRQPVLSDDGSKVVFQSASTDLSSTPVPQSQPFNIYAYDVSGQSNSLVSINSSGDGGGNQNSGLGSFPELSITPNGRFVVFDSNATNLVPIVTPGGDFVYRRDLFLEQTDLVSVSRTGTEQGISRAGGAGRSISDDGRFVVFGSNSGQLINEDIPGNLSFGLRAFVRDMEIGNTVLLMPDRTGIAYSRGTAQSPSISRNGRMISFATESNDVAQTDTNNALDVFVRKLTFPAVPVADYDGDGKTDFVVWRPENGYWYTMPNTGIFTSSVLPWGTNGDKIVPADYNGDGRADYAVFRPSTGLWYIIISSNFSGSETNFGLAGDIPMPADYDGDGKANLAVYRPTNGTWYILLPNGQTQFVPFGLSTDVPVMGDFDGDGKADIAVFRPLDGDWYILQSSNGQVRIVRFGLNGDKAVPADYDGDGKTDLAVYRDGTWYINKSLTGQILIAQFGLPTDIPSPGRYDDDSKTDIAVFRPSDGNWYSLLSETDTFSVVHFGQTGDITAPSAYIR